jgi:hypothetical protein
MPLFRDTHSSWCTAWSPCHATSAVALDMGAARGSLVGESERKGAK